MLGTGDTVQTFVGTESRGVGVGVDTGPVVASSPPPAEPGHDEDGSFLRRYGAELIAGAIILLALLQGPLSDTLDRPLLQTWSTLLVSVVVQALPFLVLGVVVSALIAAFLPAEKLAAALPRNRAVAVAGAGAAGVLLPGCECGSVPISGRLVSRGVAPAAALAFMLAAPAINPVVMAATAVAFPGRPELVLARFLASLATAVVVGWLWLRIGDDEALIERTRRRVTDAGSPMGTFVATFRHDFLHAGGYLVIGAAAAASLQLLVPRAIIDTVAGNPVLAIAAMATLAILLSICSEADAFVATGLTQFSLTSRLVFLVVGPAVDLKLIALQAAFFGRSFAARFAPLTVAVAIASAVLFGGVLL